MLSSLANIWNNDEKKRVVKNFFSLSVLQGVNYVLPLITWPYLVRVLGVERFGLLAFAASSVAYFQILTDFGFNLTATREISIHRRDMGKVSEIFSSVLTIKFFLLASSISILTLVLFCSGSFSGEWKVYFFSFGTVLGQSLLPVWLFQGMEQMKYITYLNISAKTLFTIAIFIFVHNENDYLFVPLLISAGHILSGAFSLFMVKSIFGVRFRLQPFSTLKFRLHQAHHIFISEVAINIYTVSTTFLLGIFTNNKIVGYYAGGDKIISALKGLMVPVSHAIYPYISRKFTVSKEHGFNLIKKISRSVALLAGLLSAAIFIFAEILVKLILGDQYMPSVEVLKVLAILPLLVGLSNVYGVQGLYALGLQHIVKKYLLKISLIHVAYSMVLMYYFDFIGAAVSVLITESMVALFSYLYFRAASSALKGV